MMQKLARHARLTAILVALTALVALLPPPGTLWAQTLQVANSAADLTGKILMVANSTTPRTVTNAFTFDRSPSAPFAVTAASGKVANLDADKLDGIDSVRLVTATATTTSTGTQNNFDPSGVIASGAQYIVIYCNNAGTLTVTGLAAGVFDGQTVTFVTQNTGVTTFNHQNVGTTASGRVINAVAADTSISTGGYIRYVYDLTTARWRVIVHNQGAWISYTPTIAANGGGFVMGGSTINGAYYLDNRNVDFKVIFTFSTGGGGSLGAGALTFTFPSPYILNGNWVTNIPIGTIIISDSGTGSYTGVAQTFTPTTFVGFNSNAIGTGIGAGAPIAVYATGDQIFIQARYETQ